MVLSKYMYFVLFTSLVLLLTSCRTKKPQGEGYKNYPDMSMIVRDNLSPFKTFPKSFLITNGVGAKKDSQRMLASKIDWKYWEGTLLKTNIYNKRFDHHYKLTPLSEEMSTTITYMYEPEDITLKTKKVNVVLDAFTNQVQSIYVEYSDPGFFSSESYKILFVYGKFIQIQERTKKPFQKLKETVQQIYFME